MFKSLCSGFCLVLHGGKRVPYSRDHDNDNRDKAFRKNGNDKEVSMTGLGEELLSFDTGTTKKEEFPVSLEADSEVTNGTIVKIFDVIRESGYCVINLRTTAEK